FRFDADVLQKLLAGVLKIVAVEIRQPKIEMDKRQIGAHRSGSLEFADRRLIFLPVQMGLAHEEMEFGRVLAYGHELLECALLNLFAASLARGIAQDIKIAQAT